MQDSMEAMVFAGTGRPLEHRKLPVPVPGLQEVLIKIISCGICRTDLHILDGELAHPKPNLIPGHEIIGQVASIGSEVTRLHTGMYVGVPWLGYTCGRCDYCLQGKENLCEQAKFTGYTIDGGFAEYCAAHEDYCMLLPYTYRNASSAPLLCAGLIGYRCWSMIEVSAIKIGLYGFGAAARILTQIAVQQGKEIYAFTKKGDLINQAFSLKLGAVWAGDTMQHCPQKLDAAIIFAPAGDLVPKALNDIRKGGTVVCGGIYMTDIPSFPYHLLREEKILRSVANLTKQDGLAFIRLLKSMNIQTDANLFPLTSANTAIEQLRNGSISGTAVLVM